MCHGVPDPGSKQHAKLDISVVVIEILQLEKQITALLYFIVETVIVSLGRLQRFTTTKVSNGIKRQSTTGIKNHIHTKKYISILNLSGFYQVIPGMFYIPVICQSLHIFSLYCSAPNVKLVSVYPVRCLVSAYISLKKEVAQLYTLHYLQSCIHCTKLKSCWENHWTALRTSAPRAICSQGGFCVSSLGKIKGQVMDHIWYILEKVTKRLTQ